MRHDEEISCIAWRPPTSIWNALAPEDKPVLISTVNSAKTPAVRVWSDSGDDLAVLSPWGESDPKGSRPQKVIGTCYWMQNPLTNSQTLVSPGGPCFPLYLSQNYIFCSHSKELFNVTGRQGELVGWTEGVEEISLHKIHNHAMIFGIVQCGDILWSLSYAPMIAGWNLRTGTVECIIPTSRGLNCLVPSPLEHTRVAIGGADNFIRVIQFGQSYPKANPVKAPIISQRLKGKIYSVIPESKDELNVYFINLTLKYIL